LGRHESAAVFPRRPVHHNAPGDPRARWRGARIAARVRAGGAGRSGCAHRVPEIAAGPSAGNEVDDRRRALPAEGLAAPRGGVHALTTCNAKAAKHVRRKDRQGRKERTSRRPPKVAMTTRTLRVVWALRLGTVKTR